MSSKKRKDNRVGRQLFQFWLDNAKPDLKATVKQFNKWRSHRKLTAWIVDMWRLWEDLAAGNLDVLYEMFPNIREKMLPPQRNDDLIEEFRLMLHSEIAAIPTLPVPAQSVGLKKMDVPQLVAPTFDDEDEIELVVKVDKTAPAKLSSNFMDSVLGLQQAAKNDN